MNALPAHSLRVALVCILCLVNCVTSASSAVVRITVTVSTEDGKRLQGCLLRALVDGRSPGVIDGVTDANGSVVLAVDLPPEASFVEIRHGFSSPSTISRADQLRISKVSTQHGIDYHFDASHRVSLVPRQFDYELSITAWTAVTVTATFVDRQGRQCSGTLYGPPMTWPGGWSRGQSHPLRALRKGAAADLAAGVSVGGYRVVKPIHLDASRTSSDVDLGAVVFDEPPAGVAIRTKLVNDQALMSSGVRLSVLYGMTVISSDGKLIASFRAVGTDANGAPVGDAPMELDSSERWQPVLPPGEYFVVPRFFMYDELQAIVMRLLAKGVDLSKSDIPRITVREGAPNDDVVDLVKCREAILRLAAREGLITNDKTK